MSFNFTRGFEHLLLAMVLAGSSCGTDGDDTWPNSDKGSDERYDAGDIPDPDNGDDAASGASGGGQTGGEEDRDGGNGQAGDPEGDSFEAFGFSIRIPQYRTVSCQSEMGVSETTEELETDFLCTFVYAGESGHIYLRSKPVGCTFLMGPVVSFEIEGAQLALEESIIDLDSALYNRGGNHVNDSFEFDYQGKHLKYYHSSFGFGWRVCQPMDCIQVFNSNADADPIQDGCSAERSLPVVCSQIRENGTYDELVDTFAPCPGDPNTEIPQG